MKKIIKMIRELDAGKMKKISSMLFIGAIIIAGTIPFFNSFTNQGVNQEVSTFNNNSSYQEAPKSAAKTVQWYLLDINDKNTPAGQSFSFTGYIENRTVAPPYTKTNGISVYPVIDGHHCDGTDPDLINYPALIQLSYNNGSADGFFNLTYTVPLNYDNSQLMQINIDCVQDPSIFIWSNEFSNMTGNFENDITTETTIELSTDNDTPILNGHTYNFIFNLRNGQGNLIPIDAPNVNLYKNNSLTDLITGLSYTRISSGSFYYTITQVDNITDLGIEFLGEDIGQGYDEYLPASQSLQIERVSSVDGDVSFVNTENSSSSYVYTEGDMAVTGSLWSNGDESNPLANELVEIFLNGESIGTTTTDSNGDFYFEFNLGAEGFSTNTSQADLSISIMIPNIAFEFQSDPSNPTTSGVSVDVEVQDDPSIGGGDDIPDSVPLRWGLFLIFGVVVAGLIIGLVMFQRHRMDLAARKEHQLRSVDYSRFNNINILYNQGRRREAIAYTYKIFSDLIYEKYGLKREDSQTLREFAIICVTKYGLDPMRTYPYLALVENIVYGFYDLDRNSFEKAMKIFGRVFQEITGTVLDFNFEMVSDGTGKEATLKIGAILDLD